MSEVRSELQNESRKAGASNLRAPVMQRRRAASPGVASKVTASTSSKSTRSLAASNSTGKLQSGRNVTKAAPGDAAEQKPKLQPSKSRGNQEQVAAGSSDGQNSGAGAAHVSGRREEGPGTLSKSRQPKSGASGTKDEVVECRQVPAANANSGVCADGEVSKTVVLSSALRESISLREEAAALLTQKATEPNIPSSSGQSKVQKASDSASSDVKVKTRKPPVPSSKNLRNAVVSPGRDKSRNAVVSPGRDKTRNAVVSPGRDKTPSFRRPATPTVSTLPGQDKATTSRVTATVSPRRQRPATPTVSTLPGQDKATTSGITATVSPRRDKGSTFNGRVGSASPQRSQRQQQQGVVEGQQQRRQQQRSNVTKGPRERPVATDDGSTACLDFCASNASRKHVASQGDEEKDRVSDVKYVSANAKNTQSLGNGAALDLISECKYDASVSVAAATAAAQAVVDEELKRLDEECENLRCQLNKEKEVQGRLEAQIQKGIDAQQVFEGTLRDQEEEVQSLQSELNRYRQHLIELRNSSQKFSKSKCELEPIVVEDLGLPPALLTMVPQDLPLGLLRASVAYAQGQRVALQTATAALKNE